MSYLSRNIAEEESRGGVRSFLSSIVENEKKQKRFCVEDDEEDALPSYKSIELSGGEEDIEDPNGRDCYFFNSLTKKWVNLEDFTTGSAREDGEGSEASLRLWDESLSKIDEVTERSTVREQNRPKFLQTRGDQMDDGSVVRTSRRPIIVSTPSSSVSSSPFDKSATPPIRRRALSSSSSLGNNDILNSPTRDQLQQHAFSSRRSSVDDSVDSFPVNYSKTSYNNNSVKTQFPPGRASRGRTGSYNNSPAPERRRKKSVVPPTSSTPIRRQNRSQSISNFSRFSGSNLNKNKSYSSGNISTRSDYSHVQSKVKAYIKSVKDLPKKSEDNAAEYSSFRSGKKSLSMSNLASSRQRFHSGSQQCLNSSTSNVAASNLKSFLSYANLDEMTITVNKLNAKSADNLNSKSKFDTSRLSRLLDNISDEEAVEEIIESGAEDDEIVIDVENILKLALNERRDKQEAKKVLSQLQSNYDLLQRKYAEAENTIDKLRFGSSTSYTAPTTPTNQSRDFLNLANSGINKYFDDVSSIPAPLPRTTPVSKKERNDATKLALVDIQDQLYGLELLSDTLDPKEKEAAMDEVRSSFHNIVVDLDSQRGINLMDNTQMEPEILELLKQIGKKLYVKPLPSSSRTEKPKEIVDSFEKVSNWKTASTSNYGSMPGSPTPRVDQQLYSNIKPSSKIADILLRQQCDFDSGCCPGSERSVRSKDSSWKKQLGSGQQSYSKKKNDNRTSLALDTSSTTTSIQEEDDEDGRLSGASRRRIKIVDTDLSSSEAEMETEKSGIPSSGQPAVIAQQIDKEIHELRSFFEDHRDEMMGLISQDKRDEFHPRVQRGLSTVPSDVFVIDDNNARPASSSSSRRSLSSLHFAAVSSSSPPVSPGGTRRSAGFPLNSPLHSRYHTQSQSLRRCGHTGVRPELRKKIDSEDTAEDLSMDDREIRRREFERRRKSKLTKRRSRESLVVDMLDDEEEGRSVSVDGDRRIFIPKLKVEDLWTDRTTEEDNNEDEEEKGGFSSSASSSNPNNNIKSSSTPSLIKSSRKGGEGKKKPNKEMKELLRSLEQANKMATKIKERSEEMLTVLKSEMASNSLTPSRPESTVQ